MRRSWAIVELPEPFGRAIGDSARNGLEALFAGQRIGLMAVFGAWQAS